MIEVVVCFGLQALLCFVQYSLLFCTDAVVRSVRAEFVLGEELEERTVGRDLS